MRRILSAIFLAMIIALSAGGAVLADHDHNLITPGTTVVDVADGQTEKCASAPGGHQFHVRVHLGTPGTHAWANPRNPVSIVKTENASC